MSDKAKNRLLKYGITGAVALAMILGYICTRDYSACGFWELDRMNQYLILCDAFTVPAVLLLCGGCLMWLSGQGAMDGVGFALSYAVKMLIPGMRDGLERYGDYVERKRENRTKGYGFLFVVGGILMAFALIFLVLYHSV